MTEEKKITFGFSKIKKTSTVTLVNESVKSVFISKTDKKPTSSTKKHFGSSDQTDSDDEDAKDLITVIEDKKVKSVNGNKNEKKVPVIPLKASTYRTPEELEAIKALITDAKNESDLVDGVKVVNKNLKIDASEKAEEERTDDPDYEAINIEDFGMACLRGMGWKENAGIGKTNLQNFKVVEPELRPRGLGLGANLNKKRKADDDETTDQNKEQRLIYVKGAYVKILSGIHEGKYGQLISFDDGLNRILVKLAQTDETVSILQTMTELVTRRDYDKYGR